MSCSSGIQHISEGSKSNCCKNSNYNKSFGCQGEEWITVELQDPFCNWAIVKMREAVFALCQNSVAFTLPTTVAPVECTLVTMVVLRSFSAALITSLSLNSKIFIRFCCEALLCTCNCKPSKSDNEGLERKWQLIKEANFRPISFEIQLPEITLKPISIADRNVVRQAEFCIPDLADVVSLMR